MRGLVSIGRYPILTWYHDEFRKMLVRPSAKLMAIGYSFSDTHINDGIVDGLAAGLKLFVLDPYALKVFKNDPRIRRGELPPHPRKIVGERGLTQQGLWRNQPTAGPRLRSPRPTHRVRRRA